MKRRVRILHPGYLVGTKGHSVLKKKTYIRKPLIEVDEFSYSKMPTSRRHEIDSMGSFHNAAAFSNAVMDDSYDLQAQSRGRDHRLLAQMNNALHTDSPLTSPLLSSRSSNPRNISQLQHNTHRSTRLDTTGTDSLKTSKTSDSLKPSKMADSFKPASQKLARLSEFLKAKPPATFKLSKQSKPSDLLKKSKASETLQLSKSTESKKRPKPSESLQLSTMPDRGQKPLISGVERMSPVVEHARNLVNRHKTFGMDSKLDNIATSAITSPRDSKTDFFSVSPLSNYVKARWPEREAELELPSSLTALEGPRTSKKDLYKNPYLESDDEDYETSIVVKSKNSKPGDLLKALRKNRSPPQYTTDDGTDIEDEDYAKGAYAITKEDEIQKPRLSKNYETDDSPNELALSHLVSAAALRARSVLENLTGLLGKGGLVNIEGDIKPYGGQLTTFRLHTPFQFQGPLMIGEKPAISVGDDSFERYVFGLQEKRKQERNNVEKDTRRISKMTRSLAQEPPKQYSLKPIGYISGKNYESFSKSVVPFTTKFDKTIISPSSKKVHFDEDEEYKPSLSLSKELVPFAPKGIEDEMAVVPRRKKRYPVYEYTEDIPLKLAIQFPGSDDDKERLSVLEKIRIKALLVGDDKLDDPDRPRSRKPRTRYYADKLHNLEDKEQLSSIMATPLTSSLKASKPPNYRLESRLEPDDLIHKPSSYGTMRDQVRGVQDKLDRHRQLLDRHSNRATTDSVLGDSHAAGGGLSAGRTTEEGGADGTGKVSPLRKKLRKVICKSRHDPTYYDD